MSGRASALVGRDAEVAAVERMIKQRARLRERIAAAIRASETGELYSVEVARTVGVRYTRAASQLVSMEKAGLLTSRLMPSPGSGLGRRYYRLAGSAP